MKIDVPYKVDMTVTVDTDTGEVIEVVVADYSAKFDEGWEHFWNNDEDDEDDDPELMKAALAIAEGDSLWPEWRIG